MALFTFPQRIQHRRGTYTELYSRNETLLAGEECFETHDVNGLEQNPPRQKIGDGSTPWNDLQYVDLDADIAAITTAATSKATPVDADELPLVDSAASNALKKLTWANLKATLKTYFDTLYRAAGSIGTSDISNDAVTYAKMQNVSATSRILGRKSASAGDPEECTLSDILDFIGSAAHGDILYRGASGWARLPAGTAGNVLQTNGAGANPSWVTPSGGSGGTWAAVKKTSDESRASTTTLADDSQLVVTLAAGTWRVRTRLFIKATSATPGFKYALAFSGTTTAIYGRRMRYIGGTALGTDNELTISEDYSGALGTAIAVGGGVGISVVELDYIVVVSAPGNLSIQWAQNVSNASAVTMLAGNMLEYTQT